jgi:hypothetical protein
MLRTQCRWQKQEIAIVQLYIDSLRHERACEFSGVRGGCRPKSGFGDEIGGVCVETDNGALDVLYSKGLLDGGGEPYSHAVMEENHWWKASRFLDAGYPK